MEAFMGKLKGSKHVSAERKRTILDIFCIIVKQKSIVRYYSTPQSTVNKIFRRGMRKNKKKFRNKSMQAKIIEKGRTCAVEICKKEQTSIFKLYFI